ncbi:Bifunctional purine biosynthesis protein PurH [Clavibacter michiganensis]|uniref:Bifunctional purine biosynthesis protein PurH n=1 Tax=Clavibacter michiganensis TaxID=28447 RepID=A0A251XWX6_9MICO|nr:Bifunctional purine biosynthesis protein PurH [Clavibacter michiganensis]
MSGPRHDPSLFRDRDGIEVARALVSVSDKTGLVELAAALAAAGVEIVSTGSTASTIAAAGFPVTQVQDVTGFPESLDGRVKTLHPAVHAGLLADLRLESHEVQLAELGISPFQLVVVNLYPFVETVASGAPASEVIEQVDIGGPAMVRASAKNHANVAIVVSPSSYAEVIAAVGSGGTTLEQRRRLAAAAFAHTADYDRAVADYFRSTVVGGEAGTPTGAAWPDAWEVAGDLAQVLRYGENSHQDAALYRRADGAGIAQAVQLHGKEMSYNNFVDADAAVRAAYDFAEPAVAIIKHANPCGIAVAAPRAVDAIASAHRSAHDCDPVSAFGGVIAANRTVTLGMAETVKEIFTEVLVAPGFDDDALTLLKTKRNLRLLTLPEGYRREELEARHISGGTSCSPGTRSPWTGGVSPRRGPWRQGTPWTTRPSRTSSSPGRRAAR